MWVHMILFVPLTFVGLLVAVYAFAVLRFVDRRKRMFFVSSAKGYINNDFAVVYYSGGAAASKTGIEHVLSNDGAKMHFSGPVASVASVNVDLVLEHCGYKTDGFILEKLVVRIPKSAPYPLATGLIWVHEELDARTLARYTKKYDNFTLEDFKNMKRTGAASEPVAYFAMDGHSVIIMDIGMPAPGKYLHLKFLTSSEARASRAEPRVDVEYLGFVGFNRYAYWSGGESVCSCGYVVR